MFVHNESGHKVVLRRGHVSDRLATATVVTLAAFDCRAPGALVPLPRRAVASTDPPDTSRHALWHGVSVTARGTVVAGAGAAGRKDVTLRVGRWTRTLAVFGPRRWLVGAGGGTVPSAPLPFDSLPLSYEHAFGGAYELPPGPMPHTRLPHPGGSIAEPRNPGGVGFHRDGRAAVGKALPRIEWADSLVRRAEDRPEPAGFAPCPTLEGLRFAEDDLRGLEKATPGTSKAGLLAAFPDLWARLAHHAHGRLIFDRVDVGTEIELLGLGTGPIAFTVPDLHLSAALLTGSRRAPRHVKPLRVALRALHIDADEGVVLFSFGAAGTYAPNTPPSWVLVSIPGNGAPPASGARMG